MVIRVQLQNVAEVEEALAQVMTQKLYEQLFYKLTEGRPMTVTPEMGAEVIGIIELCHVQNPLPRKY